MKLGSGLAWLVVLSVLGLLGFGLTRDANELPNTMEGNPAPTFELTELYEDTVFSLAALEGKVAVVNFWASWCLACIEEHPSLVRAWRRYEDQDVVMIGIVYQDSPANARRYLEKHGGGWPQLLDPGSRTAIDYGVYGIPETFFIDRAGVIAHKHIGPVTDALLTDEIDRLLTPAEATASPTPGSATHGDSTPTPQATEEGR